MTNNFLWIALVFFISASILPKRYRDYRLPVGGTGWVFFAIYWALEPLYYFKESDISMIFLMFFVSFLCLIIAHLMLRTKKEALQNNPVNREKTLLTATTATAVGCLFYFPFAEIELFHHFLISSVTNQTIWLSHLAGLPVVRMDWNLTMLEGYKVEIILACTAIESIALFFGIILGVKAEIKRVALALLASVPVIYILNLIRNVFVIGAYGYEWFGTGPLIVNILGNEYYIHESASFFIGHHIIAKAGSGIALFFIAYAVLKLMPELLELIDNLWLLIKEDVRKIFWSG